MPFSIARSLTSGWWYNSARQKLGFSEKLGFFYRNCTTTDKRSQLIGELLGREQYGQHLADMWQGLLIPQFSSNKQRVPIDLIVPWLSKQFNDNRPWDKTAYDILTAEGPSLVENPAMLPFVNDSTVLNPAETTDLVSTVFLGAYLKCAQCHDHPFAGWTRKDYWEWPRSSRR